MSHHGGRRTAKALVLGFLAGGAVVGVMAYPLALHFRLFELFNFVRPEIFLVTLGALLVSLPFADRFHRLLMVALTLANLLLVVVPGLLFAAEPAEESCGTSAAAPLPGTVRLLSLNVLQDSRAFQDVVDLVGRSGPDLIVLQEMTKGWRAALSELSAQWPYRVGDRIGNGEVNVLSRWPVVAGDSIVAYEPTGRRTQSMVLIVGTSRGPVRLVAVHAATPRDTGLWATRNTAFGLLSEQLQRSGDGTPTVVAGDWNTARWSPVFQAFLADTGLRDADRSLWPMNTRFFDWPGSGTLLGSAVDHIAVSPDIGVACFRVGPAVGSDHLPLIVDLQLP